MSEPFIAEIKLFAGNFAPRGYAFCAGQLLPISQNTALFSLVGTTYGGDGRTTFGLPDLRGRVVVGSEGNAAGPGLTPRPLGEKGGAQSVSLSALEIPSHTHSANAVGPGGNSNDAIGNFWADDVGVSSGTYHSGPETGTMNSNAIGNAGGSQSHNNMQPYLAVNYIIALVGLFPSRN
jgi:microcystin-dependent protein